MKKIVFLSIFLLFLLTSCNSFNPYAKSSWVERLSQKIVFENEYLYAECSYVDKQAMTKNIASEGMNPFIYKDSIITRQESIFFSLLIIPKINFMIKATEITIKTEVASYPVIFKEFAIDQNVYETSIDSQTKKMKEFVQKYFIGLKENYRANERKVRFLYSILNIDYKSAIIKVPIHTVDGKLSVLSFVFQEITR